MQKSNWIELKEYILNLWEETLPAKGDYIHKNTPKQQVHTMLSILLEKMGELEKRPVLRADRRIK